MRTSFAHSMIALSTLALSIAACSDTGEPTTPAPTQKNPNTLSIGLVVSLSGPAKALGEEAKRGAEVAVAQINALGGVLNKQLVLEVQNDSSDPRITKQKIIELKDRGITLGVGPSTSTSALEMKDLIVTDQVVYISPSATSKLLDQLTEAKPEEPPIGEAPLQPVFFRTAPTDIFLSAALASFADLDQQTSTRRCQHVSLVVQNDSYGAPIAEIVMRYFKDYYTIGLKSRLDLDPNTDNTAKFEDAAARVATDAKALTDPAKCQVVIAQPAVAAAYMRAWKKYIGGDAGPPGGWTSFLTIGSDGFRQNEFLIAGRTDPAKEDSPTAGEGSYAVAAITTPDTPQYSAFKNLFQAQFPGLDPGRYGSTAYDATILLGAAIERAGTATDHKKIRDTLWKIAQGRTTVTSNKMTEVFDLLRRGEDINYEGASGSLDFATNGSVQSVFGVWKIENGKFSDQPITEFDESDLSRFE